MNERPMRKPHTDNNTPEHSKPMIFLFLQDADNLLVFCIKAAL